MLLWALILLFSSASFQYSHIIGGINRVFLGLYKAVGEAAVIVYDEFGEETTPHFDTGYFEQSVISYFDTALSSYAANYEVGFSYYCPETGEKCVSRCQEADVYFKCPIPMLHEIKKSARFVIKEGFHGGR